MVQPSQINTRDRGRFDDDTLRSPEAAIAAWLIIVYMQLGGRDAWEEFSWRQLSELFLYKNFFHSQSITVPRVEAGIGELLADGYLRYRSVDGETLMFVAPKFLEWAERYQTKKPPQS